MTHFAHTADPFYSYAKKNPTLLMNKPPYIYNGSVRLS